MSEKQIISTHYPYLPLTITVRKRTETLEALLDTGFDGDIVLPPGLITNGKPPDSYARWTLADGSRVLAPAYLGTVAIEGLEDAGPFPAMINILGNELPNTTERTRSKTCNKQRWTTGSLPKIAKNARFSLLDTPMSLCNNALQ